MKKAFLILFMSFFGTFAFAQSSPPKEAEKQQPAVPQESPSVELQKEAVKAVPAAKEAPKPQRISTTGNKNKPARVRPARSPRPSARPIRAGRGR